MSDEQALDAAWVQIENWYAANGIGDLLAPGASADDVEDLEGELGLRLPDVWRRSLMRHDGSEEGGWPEINLLSCAGIADQTGRWRSALDEGYVDDSTWSREWICLDEDAAGNGHFIDLAADGEVRYMDHETGPEADRFAADLVDYLEVVAQALTVLQWDGDGFVER